MFYVPDVDKSFAQAVAAGGKVKNAVKDQFYGDRSGTLTDPFGFMWTIATHTEDVSPAEMQKSEWPADDVGGAGRLKYRTERGGACIRCTGRKDPARRRSRPR